MTAYKADWHAQRGTLSSMHLTLTLWLRLADKSAQKLVYLARMVTNQPVRFDYCATDGRQIGPLDSTIVARMADKSASGLPTFERQKLMFIYI